MLLEVTALFCKELDANTIGFVGSTTITVPATQLWRQSAKAALDNIYANGCGCVPIKLYLQTQVVGQTGAVGLSLWTPTICC